MTNRDDISNQTSQLRRQAEEIALEKPALSLEDIHALSAEDIQQRFHELRVHQIELEMQNEELRTAQVEIEAGRERYYDLYDQAPVGYCTLSEHGLILEANLTVATLLGMTRSALIEQPISHFILKDDQNIYSLHRKKLFETGEPRECELRLVKPDGDHIWAHMKGTVAEAEDGAPVCRVVLSDITEQKRAEEVLRRSEMFLRSTVDGLTAHIIVLDDQGEIILTNKAYRDFGAQNGIEPRTVSEGVNYLAVCDSATGEHSEEATHFADGIREVLSGKLPFFELEYPCHSPSEKRWFVAHVTPFDDEGPQQVIVAHENITARKQAEAEREKLQSQLAQAQKAESMGRMAGAIAHIFNNQLGVVIGNLDMAIEDLPRDAKPVTNLTAAMQGARKAAQVSGLMLTYLGQTTGLYAPLDLSESCRRSLPSLRARISPGLILEVNLPSPGPTVKANTNQIQQMLTNLVTNAQEAIGAKQGTVTLTVKTVPQADISGVHRYPPDWQAQNASYACLEVTDTGCGIADEAIDKIFDPFFSTKFTGRGLGLPVVFGIAGPLAQAISDGGPTSGVDESHGGLSWICEGATLTGRRFPPGCQSRSISSPISRRSILNIPSTVMRRSMTYPD